MGGPWDDHGRIAGEQRDDYMVIVGAPCGAVESNSLLSPDLNALLVGRLNFYPK